MTTNSTRWIHPTLRGSPVLSSSSCLHFKIPAPKPPTFQFVGQPIKAKAPATPPPPIPRANERVSRPSDLFGRRELFLLSTTVPFLVPSPIAVAADEIFQMREEIGKVLSKGKAAGVLRLVFHDAGTFDIYDKTGGMNGSILHELDRPENKGLKKSVKIPEKAKSQIDILYPVSWADLIAVAGAEAVSVCGGPKIPVQLGRIDSMLADPEQKLPEESLDAAGLKQCFQRTGFSTQELVALSGAHTLGSKGFGNPTIFDNSYFKILLEKPWLSSAGMSAMIGLPSDRALVEDDECTTWISKYANDQNLFFEDFKDAYIKLVNTGARWRSI
ncbi:putative L-ascorbate peroxidase 6 isoform X1 [Coffea arabica]|uniref:L-ascorbate peroxidase 6 isoform X1 n=1 Tax=Coffea arabica TaxID=13443 RepID=A0A6P6U1L7_COFAR